jgi:hypothetical protein
MLEQRVDVKFCVELQKLSSKTLDVLKTAYDESTMSKSNIFKWHKRLREGREDANDDERQCGPLTKRTDENVARIRELVRPDRRLTCWMPAGELDISKRLLGTL